MDKTSQRSVFVIGDGISIDYEPYLKELLAGIMNFDRKGGIEEARKNLDNPIGANGGDSSMVLSYLLDQNRSGVKYDILMINCGLHDIKTDPVTNEKQVDIVSYRKNLTDIITLAKKWQMK